MSYYINTYIYSTYEQFACFSAMYVVLLPHVNVQ